MHNYYFSHTVMVCMLSSGIILEVITNHVSMGGNAIGSVDRPSNRLFPL